MRVTRPAEPNDPQSEFRLRKPEDIQRRPTILIPSARPIPTIVYETYWRFASERQEIFFKRLRGDSAPWTSDPILQKYKFTNVYRACDRVSQYLIGEVIYKGDQSPKEVFFRTMLFKLFNRIETWELLSRHFGAISCADFNLEQYDRVLTSVIDSGGRLYSPAYIMPPGGAGPSPRRKHSFHLSLLERMVKEDLPARLSGATSMGSAFEMIRAYPGIGSFLACQYVTDLNYSTVINFSEMSFVEPGPGCISGIRKCFSGLGEFSEADIVKLVAERQSEEFGRFGLEFQTLGGRPLQLIDCQSLFCEVDKYARVMHPRAAPFGRTRIKQLFR